MFFGQFFFVHGIRQSHEHTFQCPYHLYAEKNSCLKLHFSPLRLVLKESIWCPPSPSFNMSLHQSGDFFFILKMVRVLGEQYLDL